MKQAYIKSEINIQVEIQLNSTNHITNEVNMNFFLYSSELNEKEIKKSAHLVNNIVQEETHLNKQTVEMMSKH